MVAGRPSERWGNEVVAIVQLREGRDPSDDELLDTCQQHVARYKLPKAIIRTAKVQRSPAGKADYRVGQRDCRRKPFQHSRLRKLTRSYGRRADVS